MKAQLVHCTSDGNEKRFTLKPGKNRVGRSPDNDVRIQVEAVSRHHCEFYVELGKILLVDQKSANGTFVNGLKIDRAELNNGDLIKIGPVEITLHVVASDPIEDELLAMLANDEADPNKGVSVDIMQVYQDDNEKT